MSKSKKRKKNTKSHKNKKAQLVTIEPVNSNTVITNDMETVFEKYANKYNVDTDSTKEKLDNVEREKYVYQMLSQKGLENTGVEKLLDLTIEDIQHQYSMKQDMEYKAGFMTALWGVLIAIVIQEKYYMTLISYITNDTMHYLIKVSSLLILVGLVLSGIETLYYIAKTMVISKYSRYLFNNKELNFRCAVEDKNMLLTKLLDSNTSVWIKNEEANKKKYKCLKLLVIWIVVFILFIVICSCIQ